MAVSLGQREESHGSSFLLLFHIICLAITASLPWTRGIITIFQYKDSRREKRESCVAWRLFLHHAVKRTLIRQVIDHKWLLNISWRSQSKLHCLATSFNTLLLQNISPLSKFHDIYSLCSMLTTKVCKFTLYKSWFKVQLTQMKMN